MADLKSFKDPVQSWYEKRQLILDALAEHEKTGAAAIGKLIDAAGQTGPFKLGDSVVVFRKSRGGDTYLVFPYEERETL